MEIISTQIVPLVGISLFISMRHGVFGYRVIYLPKDAEYIRLDEGFLWSELKWNTADGSAFTCFNYANSLFPIRIERKD